MSARDLPMMPWFPNDFMASTRHWDVAERGAYRDLLDAQWTLSVLPSARSELARLVGCELERFEGLWQRVASKFSEVPGGLQNERLEEHRKRAVELRDSRVRGARSVNAKRDAERSAERVAPATHPSPSPSPSKEKKIAAPPLGLDNTAWSIWTAYRTQIKKPIKPASIEAAQRDLATYGKDQQAVVEQSIAAGYQGLFALKVKSNGTHQPALTRIERADARLDEWARDRGIDPATLG